VDLPQAIDVNSVKIDYGEGMIRVSASKQLTDEPHAKRTTARRAAPKKSRAKTA
jgi:hypothetical protein